MDDSQFIRLTRFFLKWHGLWQVDTYRKTLSGKISYVFSILCQLTLALFGISNAIIVWQSYAAHVPFGPLFLNMAFCMDIVRTIIKLYVYQKYNIYSFIDGFVNEEKKINCSKDEEIKKSFSSYCKFCAYVVSSQAIPITVTILMYYVLQTYESILINIENIKNNQSIVAADLCHFHFPNKDKHWVIHYIVNLFIGYQCNLICICYVVPTTCFVFCASQLQILQIKLRKLRQVAEEEYGGNVKNALIDLIGRHQYLIKFTANINMAFRNLILIDFLLTSIIDASIAGQIIEITTESHTLGNSVSAIMYFSGSVLLLFSTGWTCNEISIQSTALANAIYDSEWYEFDSEVKQILQILVMRAQRPLTIDIGLFGPMTNNTVIMVLKATYSYITIMKR